MSQLDQLRQTLTARPRTCLLIAARFRSIPRSACPKSATKRHRKLDLIRKRPPTEAALLAPA